MTCKHSDLPPGTATVDIELGRLSGQMYFDWITDTTVDDGQAWGEMTDARYKMPTELLRYLIDNVSKNGCILLNVGPKADGTIPDEARAVWSRSHAWSCADLAAELLGCAACNGNRILGSGPDLPSAQILRIAAIAAKVARV